MLRQIFMLADKSTLREAMILFWDEDIAFLGHTKWSTKHSGNNQRGTVKDTRLQVLEAVNISAPIPTPLSLSLHTGADTQALFTQCLPVECIVVFFFYLFRYSLISIHLVKKNSTRTAVGVILNILWWNAPMFYHLWCQTNAALMMTSTNNPLFSSNCTTWLIHVHRTWSEESILVVLHIIPLDMQFRHVQRHVRLHVNIFQWPLHVMDACQNCVTMDAMAGNQGRNALISVSTTVFDVHSTMVSSLKSWLCYFRSFSKVATKLSCLSLLLDKVYWTFNIILNFEDDLGS